ncbi:LysR family transcriptional regulator [Yersinia ruckeri]
MKLSKKEMEVMSCISKWNNSSKAGDILSIAQANMSKYLSNIESKVGLVFKRNQCGISLNDYGIKLSHSVNEYLQAEAQLASFISNYKRNKDGVVTIYSSVSIGLFLTKHIIHKLELLNDISISFKTYNPSMSECVSGVPFPDDCDILLSYVLPKDKSTYCKEMRKISLSAYANKKYLNDYSHIPINEIEKHECILYLFMSIDKNSNSWAVHDNKGNEGKTINVFGKYYCDHQIMALELAANGLGIAFANNLMAQPYIDNGSLQQCIAEEIKFDISVKLIHRGTANNSYIVNTTIQELVKVFNNQSMDF